jgi:hypothetical protein
VLARRLLGARVRRADVGGAWHLNPVRIRQAREGVDLALFENGIRIRAAGVLSCIVGTLQRRARQIATDELGGERIHGLLLRCRQRGHEVPKVRDVLP